jgi:hypothetical protein
LRPCSHTRGRPATPCLPCHSFSRPSGLLRSSTPVADPYSHLLVSRTPVRRLDVHTIGQDQKRDQKKVWTEYQKETRNEIRDIKREALSKRKQRVCESREGMRWKEKKKRRTSKPNTESPPPIPPPFPFQPTLSRRLLDRSTRAIHAAPRDRLYRSRPTFLAPPSLRTPFPSIPLRHRACPAKVPAFSC